MGLFFDVKQLCGEDLNCAPVYAQLQEGGSSNLSRDEESKQNATIRAQAIEINELRKDRDAYKEANETLKKRLDDMDERMQRLELKNEVLKKRVQELEQPGQ